MARSIGDRLYVVASRNCRTLLDKAYKAYFVGDMTWLEWYRLNDMVDNYLFRKRQMYCRLGHGGRRL